MIEQYQREKEKLNEILLFWLRKGFVDITFEKGDGTIREMRATLLEDHIPQYEKKTDRVKAKRTDQITVVDSRSKMWRNIKLENIRDIVIVTGEDNG